MQLNSLSCELKTKMWLGGASALSAVYGECLVLWDVCSLR